MPSLAPTILLQFMKASSSITFTSFPITRLYKLEQFAKALYWIDSIPSEIIKETRALQFEPSIKPEAIL